MLPASSRLRRRIDFSVTVRSGRRASRGALVVHLATADSAGSATGSVPTESSETRLGGQPPRAGFVVSKAVGGAVTRNRVKRRLRHLVRGRLDDLPRGANLVVRALPEASNRTYAQLGQDLDEALAAARRPRRRSGER